MARTGLLFLALLGIACGSTPATSAPTDAPKPLPERGIVVVPYVGAYRDVPAFAAALDSREVEIEAAKAALRTRLGLALDPDRPRRLLLVDDTEEIRFASALVAGRRQQTIALPAAPVARGETDLPSLLRTAFARAAISDAGPRAFPAWYEAGAPLWLGGGFERARHAAALGPDRVATEPTGVVPPLDLDDQAPDPLAAALFFRFLETEFGPGSVPDLTRALAGGADAAEALHVATRADAASLPVAYEGWVLRTVGEITDDPAVRALAAARDLGADAAAERLDGMEEKTEDPWVAAEVRYRRAMAHLAAGRVAMGQIALLRLVTRDAAYLLDLDGARTTAALGPGARTEAGLRAFLRDFPASPNRPAAEFALGEILRDAGETEAAEARFRSVVETAPESPSAAPAAVALAAAARERGYYGTALAWLDRAGDDPAARRLAAEIREETARGLPDLVAAEARAAVAALGSEDEREGNSAVRRLAAIGPAAAPMLIEALSGPGRSGPDLARRRRAARVAAAWPAADARPLLERLLADPDPETARPALEALLSGGLGPEALRALVPPGSPAARELDRRFGAASLPPDVRDLLASGDFEGRVAAARRLALVPGFDATSTLLDLAADPSPPVRKAAADALAARAGDAAKRALGELAADEAVTVRLAAYASLATREDGRGLLRRGLDDRDGRVRTEVAALLLEGGRPEDAERVVALLDDPDPAVRAGVDRLLRRIGGTAVGRALARALPGAAEPGHAMRIVRVMAHLAGEDFGYDPAGTEPERRRVAARFSEFLAKSASAGGE